jgi:hypothetical protein
MDHPLSLPTVEEEDIFLEEEEAEEAIFLEEKEMFLSMLNIRVLHVQVRYLIILSLNNDPNSVFCLIIKNS